MTSCPPALRALAAACAMLACAPAWSQAWPAALLERVQKIDAKAPGNLGVYVKRLSDDSEMSYAGDRRWYLASTAKVPIAVAVLKKIEDGDLHMDQEFALEETDKIDGSGDLVWQDAGKRYTVEDLLDAMLFRSDNTASNVLIRIVGEDALNRTARDAMGRREVGELTSFTRIRHDVYSALHPKARELSNEDLVKIAAANIGPNRVRAVSNALDIEADALQVKTMEDAYARYYATERNTATLEGYSAMLEKLVRGKLLTDAHRDALYVFMKLDDPGGYRLAGGLPPKTPFIHKTGTQYQRACHIGVVNPREDAIIVAACVENMDEAKPSENVLREVGQAVTQTLLNEKG